MAYSPTDKQASVEFKYFFLIEETHLKMSSAELVAALFRSLCDNCSLEVLPHCTVTYTEPHAVRYPHVVIHLCVHFEDKAKHHATVFSV